MNSKNNSVNREIFRLALPAVVSNISVPLLGLSDTAISGHLGSAAYIGAIAVGSMMLNVAFWLFGFLRMGTTGLVAEAFGAGDQGMQRRLLRVSVVIALLIGVLFIMLRTPLSRALLMLMAPESAVDANARAYFDICVMGAPALLATMAVNGWFVGMQSTVRAMAVSVTVNVINILLSLWLVFGVDMGFLGVAYGTLIAQWTGLCLALVMARAYMRRTAESGGMASSPALSLGKVLKRYFTVNVNLFFRSACVMAVSMTVTAVGARLGEVTLAGNAVMMQFFIFFSYFMDGFAFAAEALVGRAKGSLDASLYSRSVRWLLIWSGCMGVLFFAVYAVGAEEIGAMITDEENVLAALSAYRIWIMLIPLLTVAAFIFDGFFIGLSRTGAMLASTLIASAVFFMIVFVPSMIGEGRAYCPDNNRLWLAFLTYLFLRGVLLAVVLPRSRSLFADKSVS